MPCQWLVKSTKEHCKRPTKNDYCAIHAFALRNGSKPPKACANCGNGTSSQTHLCLSCGQAKAYTKLWNERKMIQPIK